MKKSILLTCVLFVVLIFGGCASLEKKVQGTWEMNMEEGVAIAYFYEDGSILFETGEVISYGGDDGSIGVAERIGYNGRYYEENDTIVGYVEEMGTFTVHFVEDNTMIDLVFNENDETIVYTMTKY